MKNFNCILLIGWIFLTALPSFSESMLPQKITSNETIQLVFNSRIDQSKWYNIPVGQHDEILSQMYGLVLYSTDDLYWGLRLGDGLYLFDLKLKGRISDNIVAPNCMVVVKYKHGMQSGDEYFTIFLDITQRLKDSVLSGYVLKGDLCGKKEKLLEGVKTTPAFWTSYVQLN